MTKNQAIYCNDILERIERIERYTIAGRDSFLQNTLIQDAVVRSFEIIGEVVERLDATTKSKAPNIIWSDFAGFRDILIHRYDIVDFERVWDFIQEDIPPLKKAIQAILEEIEAED